MELCIKYGINVILKDEYGGGGSGMRVVRKMEEVKEMFERES